MPCPRKVLVVDDDPEILAALAEVLASTCGPASYVVAHDGAHALQLVRAGLRPCRILTDLNMAGMDGDELMSALVAEGLGGIPVITMTGALRRKPARATCHLAKPFSVERLECALVAAATDSCKLRRHRT